MRHDRFSADLFLNVIVEVGDLVETAFGFDNIVQTATVMMWKIYSTKRSIDVCIIVSLKNRECGPLRNFKLTDLIKIKTILFYPTNHFRMVFTQPPHPNTARRA